MISSPVGRGPVNEVNRGEGASQLTKFCPCCDQYLPIERFGTRIAASGKRYTRSYCHDCNREGSRRWKDENYAQHRRNLAEWERRHRAERNANNRARYWSSTSPSSSARRPSASNFSPRPQGNRLHHRRLP